MLKTLRVACLRSHRDTSANDDVEQMGQTCLSARGEQQGQLTELGLTLKDSASEEHMHACRLSRKGCSGLGQLPRARFTSYKWSFKGVGPPARCHLPPEFHAFQTPPEMDTMPLREVKVQTALAGHTLWCISSTYHLSDSGALPVWLRWP